jgi:hypothetical protein
MQTFLPYPHMKASMVALDYRRLGKQRVEAAQILNTLLHGGGWQNHPAVKMWRGYEDALALYHNLCVIEWAQRGYSNSMPLFSTSPDVALPPWFGNPDFHRSHRSNLLRKDPAHYRPLFPDDPDNLPYVWPVSDQMT